MFCTNIVSDEYYRNIGANNVELIGDLFISLGLFQQHMIVPVTG